MVKKVLALVGLVAVLLVLVGLNFRFLSSKASEITLQIDRETAEARAEAYVREIERKADEYGEKARKLRIDARAREIKIERDEKSQAQTRIAMLVLVEAAKKANLPKPSEAATAAVPQKVLFAGRELSSNDVYRTLNSWQLEVDRQSRQAEGERARINKLRSMAGQFESKKEKQLTMATTIRGKVEELVLQRDLAQLDKELVELGANTRGNFTGDLGNVLRTIQGEIDELDATVEVLGNETAAQQTLDPEALLKEAEAAQRTSRALDKLWE